MSNGLHKESEKETSENNLDQEQYIGSYFDFQKYLINPEFKKLFSYLTKELGIANLNPLEIFIIGFNMEIVNFLDILGAEDSKNAFLSDIYTTILLSRSKHGFGAKLLVSQITRGEYNIKGDQEQLKKKRFMNFGRKKENNREQDFEGGY